MAGGARYVYRQGEYNGKRPAAAIGITRGSRFRSDSYATHEVELAHSWVAFRSPSMLPMNVETVVLAVADIPPLPSPRIGQETNTRRIDGSRLHFVVRDGVCLQAPSNPFKAFILQKIEIDDGEGLENGHIEIRIAYYMVAHKESRRGKWLFGQFAPMMTIDEYGLIQREVEGRGWLDS